MVANEAIADGPSVETDGGSCSMTISREMRLAGTPLRDAERAPMHVMQAVAAKLSANGEACVCFDAANFTEDVMERMIDSIRKSLAGFGSEVTEADRDVVKTGREPNRVFVLFQSDVVRFDEAPWSDGESSYTTHLLEKAQQGRPFTASFCFTHSARKVLSMVGVVSPLVNSPFVKAGMFMNVSVTDVHVPPNGETGDCRVDVRIVPKEVLKDFSTHPSCENCGHIMVRFGEGFKCLNCGATFDSQKRRS